MLNNKPVFITHETVSQSDFFKKNNKQNKTEIASQGHNNMKWYSREIKERDRKEGQAEHINTVRIPIIQGMENKDKITFIVTFFCEHTGTH